MNNTFASIDPGNIPEKLSDAEARKILDQVGPGARKMADEVVRNNAHAEQGQAQMAILKTKAKELFGTDDFDGVKKIQDALMVKNATAVREYISALAQTRFALDAVSGANSQPRP